MDLSNTPSQSNGDRPQKGSRTVMSTTHTASHPAWISVTKTCAPRNNETGMNRLCVYRLFTDVLLKTLSIKC